MHILCVCPTAIMRRRGSHAMWKQNCESPHIKLSPGGRQSVSLVASYVPPAISGKVLHRYDSIDRAAIRAVFHGDVCAIGDGFCDMGGAAASTGIAVGIAYGEAFGLGFLWIIPVSPLTGIVIGFAISLIPHRQAPAYALR